MKVTVVKYLNVRVGSPRVNAPCFQYLAPGSVLEVDGRIYKGDTFDGSNDWLKDEANNYYWKGGVEMPQPTAPGSITTDVFKETDYWWLKKFNVGELWHRGWSGKGVKMVVLDSGLSLPHPDLIIEEQNMRDLSGSSSGITDKTGHGTHVTGIIKASNNGFGVKGVAYNADLYFGKITHDLRGDNVEYMVKGIKWAIELKADIVSISVGYVAEDENLKAIVNEALEKNILLVCAAGNQDDTTGTNLLYPAFYQQTLSVGGITQGDTALPDTINAAQTQLFGPGENILSTSQNKTYKLLTGSSQATPFVAGVACLLLEAKRKTDPAYKAKQIKAELLTWADKKAYGKLINPLKTAEKI